MASPKDVPCQAVLLCCHRHCCVPCAAFVLLLLLFVPAVPAWLSPACGVQGGASSGMYPCVCIHVCIPVHVCIHGMYPGVCVHSPSPSALLSFWCHHPGGFVPV